MSAEKRAREIRRKREMETREKERNRERRGEREKARSERGVIVLVISGVCKGCLCCWQRALSYPSLGVDGRAGPDQADLPVPTLCGLCLFVRCRAKRIKAAAHAQLTCTHLYILPIL